MVFSVAAVMFNRGGVAAQQKAGRTVTFNRDVAPIFYRNCVSCHRPEEIGPMSLVTYKDARPWARAIREKVVAREMPPWHADPQVGEFSNDARLSEQEIATIAAWVEQGAKEGERKDLPPARQFTAGWRIGKPDVIIEMPEEFQLSASGPDEYHYFTVPTNFKEDVWVQAAELLPGNRRIVHHAHADVRAATTQAGPDQTARLKKASLWQSHFVRTGRLQFIKPDEPIINDGCGSPDGGYPLGGDFGPQMEWSRLTSYLPGGSPETYPAGAAKLIPAGASIVINVHYSRVTGKPERDRTRLGLILAKQPPPFQVKSTLISNFLFSVPPGAEHHEVMACHTLKQELRAISYTAHMHFRGKDMKFDAVYPDGRRATIFSVPNYSFAWQRTYQLKQPVTLPKGTRLIITAHFDNSSRNKFNPNPAQAVRWGEPSESEMMDGWIDYIVDIKPPAKAAAQ